MNVTQDTMRRVQQQLLASGITWDMAKGALADMAKATFAAPTSSTTGINFYNLEPIAKRLFNSYTPVRNFIPRRQGPGGTAANWRAVTAIDTARLPMGIKDGFRAAELAHTVAEYTAKYVEIGSESSTTFLAQLAAMGFDDARALQAITGLRAAQNNEERMLIGGLGTYGLGTAGTATGANSTTPGTLSTSTTYRVRVVALSLEGLGLAVQATATVPAQLATTLTLTEAGPRARTYTVNGGASIVSADTGIATTTGTSLDVTCPATPGAAAYAWSIGSTSTNGTFTKITPTNKTNIGAVLTAGAPPSGYADTISTNFNADRSQNSLIFDGILAIIAKSGSGATVTTLDGAALNGDGAAGIVEVDTVLRTLATNSKVSPDNLWMNFAQIAGFTSKIMTPGGAGAQLYQLFLQSGAAQGAVMGGTKVTSYNNKYALDPARQSITVRVHPDVPPGTMLFTSQDLPPVSFPDANITGVFEVETLEEYTQREWPLTTRAYETGVYVTEVLKCYAPFALAALQNVG